MGAGAAHQRTGVLPLEFARRHGPEAAEVVVGWPGQSAREGNVEVVVGTDGFGEPLVIFVVVGAFAGQFVGKSAAQTRGLERAVKLNEQLMPRRRLQYFLLNVDHFLVVAIHKIDHHALDAPLLELRESLFQLPIERVPMHPHVDAHATLFSVVAHLLHIQRRDGAGHVGVFAHGPVARRVAHVPRKAAVADNGMVLNAVVGAEVDVVFVGLKVDARREGRIGRDVAVPPVEGRFTRFQPRKILLDLRVTERGNRGGFHQIADAITDEHHSPRALVGQRSLHF